MIGYGRKYMWEIFARQLNKHLRIYSKFEKEMLNGR